MELFKWFLPEILEGTEDETRALYFAAAAVSTGTAFILLGLVLIPTGFLPGYVTLILGGAILLFLAWMFKMTGAFNVPGPLYMATFLGIGISLIANSGGIISPFYSFLAAGPAIAFLIFKKSEGAIWFGLYIVAVGVFWMMDLLDQEVYNWITDPQDIKAYAFGTMLVVVFYLIGVGTLTQKLLVGDLKQRKSTQNVAYEHEQLKREHKEVVQEKQRIEMVNQHLQQMVREKTDVISMTAHDLKSPLAGIMGFTKLLQRPDTYRDASKAMQMAAYIDQSATRMLELVKKLLRAKGMEQAQSQISLNAFDLISATREVVNSYQRKAQRKNIRLYFQTAEPAMIAVGSANNMIRVLDNLISNAIKYSPPGRNVYVQLVRNGENFVAIIKDEGPGFTAQDRKRMFDRFGRLSAQPTGNESSTGMGLFIVKQLIDSMGGQIRLDSSPGHGSTFYVELPADRKPR